MDVVIASASQLPRPDEDDAPLRAALAAEGLAAETRAWDDPAVDWGRARMCVIRSTWNYVHHHRRFLEWADRCGGLTRLWNAPEVVRWNSHKRYLVELADAGLPVVPTRLVTAAGGGAELASAAEGWDDVVIKPAVSAGSLGTLRVRRGDFAGAGQAHLDDLLGRAGEALVQPYFDAVESHGERALVWIDGAFTHAVRKSRRFACEPQRISTEAIPIERDELAAAEAILARATSRSLLYARVDLVRDGRGRPCLMELELIEPSLFLDRAPPALARLAAAIRRLAE